MPKCKLCGNDFPISIVIDGKRRILSARRYCLECSPFNLHNTRPISEPIKEEEKGLKCGRCKKVLPREEFYHSPSSGKRSHFWCKHCFLAYKNEANRKSKLQWVEYKGGKCVFCKYSKCPNSLSFHHLDPSEKDPGFNNKKGRCFERMKKELDKCILVCSNCHGEIHAGMRDEDLKVFGAECR